MKRKIKIVIVDDHKIFLDGLRTVLEGAEQLEVLGEAQNYEELNKLLTQVKPDVLLLDINMPGKDGIEITKILKEKQPDVKILLLTMHNETGIIQKGLEAGIDGYVLKNTDRYELIAAIESIVEGESYYSEKVTKTIMEGLKPQGQGSYANSVKLTRREVDVMKLIAEEFTTTEIADKLTISQHTVESHRKNLLSKLNVRNTAGLVRYAVKKRVGLKQH